MDTNMTDDNLQCIFLNENDKIPIRLSLKFVSRSPIDKKQVLAQVMAWRRTAFLLNSDRYVTYYIPKHVCVYRYEHNNMKKYNNPQYVIIHIHMLIKRNEIH